jgi:hypothetical protein
LRADPFAAYLARHPESDPKILLPRSVLPLARGAFLLRGVLVEGWSVAWLAAFFAAELMLVIRLAALGDRLSLGPPLDPEHQHRRSLAWDLAWLAVALAAAAFAAQGLDRSTRGAWFSLGEGAALWAWPGWGIAAYLVFLLGEFVYDLLAARRERRAFVSTGAMQGALLIVAGVLLAFVVPFVLGFAADWFGDAGARAVIAALLVLARTGADLATLWLPRWAPGRLV